MDPTYTAFAATDAVFYDSPALVDRQVSTEFGVDATVDWSDWTVVRESHWVHFLPRERVLPDQGWKIHVSTIPAAAAETLLVTSAYCNAHAIPFKHIRSDSTLMSVLAKDANRGSAGKFITVYPTGIDELKRYLDELDGLLGGEPGPYILSDLRWNQGPLYVRYGAFARAFTVDAGQTVPAIRDPRTNRLVPDRRPPFFETPDWVVLPPFLERQLASLDQAAPAGFPSVTGALHHSNGGGVYTADLAGQAVILKEARSHSGWTPDGRDAVTRLRYEERVLSALPASVSAPRPVAAFEESGHRFLALQKVDGESLANLVVARNPLTCDGRSPADFEAYRDWALRIASSIRAQVDHLHASGVSHGDLHPRNVLVDADDQVTLIDFEMSLPITSGDAPVVGVAGFVAPDMRGPADRDLYAVACLELFLFLPLTPLLPLGAGKPMQLLRGAASLFGLGAAWVNRLIGVVGTSREDNEASLSSAHFSSQQIARQLAKDSQTSRRDRLWPGDPRQFREARYSLGHGALGVASALTASGVPLTEEQKFWIRDSLEIDFSNEPWGLMNGVAGAVWGCWALGWTDHAERALAALRAASWHALDSTLYAGIPGVGLTLLANAEARPTDAERALEMWTVLRARILTTGMRARVPTDGGGLFAGASGAALFSLRLYERFRDDAFLAFAEEAVARDLETLAEGPDGSLHVNEGWRLLPYLGYGSAGIGLVLMEMLSYGADSNHHRDALTGILRAACTPFTVQSGLLQGRAGLIHLLDTAEQSGFSSPHFRGVAEHHREALQLHALSTPDGIRFVGNGLLRASCDLASGSAGVLAVLAEREATPLNSYGPLSFLESAHHKTAYRDLPGGGGDHRGILPFTTGAGALS